ncbi:16S rRNA processing protein RimM [Serpentinicella alkaliphila]|uniref:Ribosome maturation factor RimM n=2 Tax=Serpentinicella alkaliphila TaxID=1734049 RepID=A0A4R2TPY6_9FIRM|nr:16S rRNA processing protein RimM [Serpentinicella alkaliphila]
MKMLRVGKIINTHGLKGELKVLSLSDYAERFEELEWVLIEGYKEKFYIESVKYQKSNVLITFKGYKDINQVEKFKNKYLLIDETQRRELPEGTYYIADIIGLDVYTMNNEYLGKVVDILQAGSNEVYVIQYGKSTPIMIPAVDEFIPHISIEEGKIIVNPIEGMIE